MKKLILIFAAACLLFSCSTEKTFKISGILTDFGNPDEPTMLYLKTRNANEQLVNIDSTFLTKKETFVLKGKSSETDLYFLADKDNVFFLRVFVDPGDKITVTGNAVETSAIKIEGSKTQALYDEYLSSLAPIQEEQETIRQNYMMYAQNPSIPEDEFENIEKELIASFEALNKNIEDITTEFIKANSTSIVAAYLVYRNTVTISNSAEIEQQLQLLDPTMSNKFATLVKERVEKVKQTEVGAVLPGFELPDPEGKLISLESMRGKYVLVDFWASWCRPCLGEIPNLKIAYEKYHDKGFEIISISLDDDKEAWINGVAQHELVWLNVSDLQAFNSPIAKQFAVAYVPHTFLLDPQGVILAVDLRGEELAGKLAEIMQ
ncbi:MAG: AhpC/TSA family protein [Bacteroidetes bacterium]|nr:AhpC/TSA family protein [Bacteroidota bacterium]MCL1968516.1 AhpC/TSA family protein [Bacteroidota bacterium]